MLTTIDAGQHAKSVRFPQQQTEFERRLWLFTEDNTHKIDESQKTTVCCRLCQNGQPTPTFYLGSVPKL
jgi:hypothetical protein